MKLVNTHLYVIFNVKRNRISKYSFACYYNYSFLIMTLELELACTPLGEYYIERKHQIIHLHANYKDFFLFRRQK